MLLAGAPKTGESELGAEAGVISAAGSEVASVIDGTLGVKESDDGPGDRVGSGSGVGVIGSVGVSVSGAGVVGGVISCKTGADGVVSSVFGGPDALSLLVESLLGSI